MAGISIDDTMKRDLEAQGYTQLEKFGPSLYSGISSDGNQVTLEFYPTRVSAKENVEMLHLCATAENIPPEIQFVEYYDLIQVNDRSDIPFFAVVTGPVLKLFKVWSEELQQDLWHYDPARTCVLWTGSTFSKVFKIIVKFIKFIRNLKDVLYHGNLIGGISIDWVGNSDPHIRIRVFSFGKRCADNFDGCVKDLSDLKSLVSKLWYSKCNRPNPGNRPTDLFRLFGIAVDFVIDYSTTDLDPQKSLDRLQRYSIFCLDHPIFWEFLQRYHFVWKILEIRNGNSTLYERVMDDPSTDAKLCRAFLLDWDKEIVNSQRCVTNGSQFYSSRMKNSTLCEVSEKLKLVLFHNPNPSSQSGDENAPNVPNAPYSSLYAKYWGISHYFKNCYVHVDRYQQKVIEWALLIHFPIHLAALFNTVMSKSDSMKNCTDNYDIISVLKDDPNAISIT